jgi:RNA polymerase sigma-70 factor (ECF subfamily)
MATSAQEQKSVSDTDLLERFLGGEGEAFAALVRRYERELYGFLARFTGDPAMADDVFQETFLKVYQSAALFDRSKPLRPWLYTVAANKARDALRKRGRHPAAPLDATVRGQEGQQTTYADLMPSNIPSPDETSLNRETRQAVRDMVEQMPENLRSVLILSYFQELPHKEISEILAIPVGTVKSRLHNAVRMFAEKWKAYTSEHAVPVQRPPDARPSQGEE